MIKVMSTFWKSTHSDRVDGGDQRREQQTVQRAETQLPEESTGIQKDQGAADDGNVQHRALKAFRIPWKKLAITAKMMIVPTFW